MLIEKTLYGFDDVTLIPSRVSNLSSRNEVKENIRRLLWASPMDTVIDEDNITFFHERGINVSSIRGMWKNLNVDEIPYIIISLTLAEAEDIIDGTNDKLQTFLEKYHDRFGKLRILIDVANGHMSRLLKLCENLIKHHYNIELGAGNIANPEAYTYYAELGLHWVRVGIGTGSRCHTSSKTSVHYPMISLLDEINTIKDRHMFSTNIIADGGFRNSSDIVKALAAGADGVMLGSIFNKAVESAGTKYPSRLYNEAAMFSSGRIDNKTAVEYYKMGREIEVDYRGMSTIAVQEKENGDGNHRKYEEGFSKRNKVKYTLDECLHEIDYSVKSAFSYCNSKTLDEFQTNSKIYLVNNLNNHNRI